MNHFVFAPTQRSFQLWCASNNVQPHDAFWITNFEQLRGINHSPDMKWHRLEGFAVPHLLQAAITRGCPPDLPVESSG